MKISWIKKPEVARNAADTARHPAAVPPADKLTPIKRSACGLAAVPSVRFELTLDGF
jgi:hypothetical protein